MSTFSQSMETIIGEVVRTRMHTITEEEIAACVQRVRDRVAKEMDALALETMRYYSIEDRTDRLVISVRKPDAP